MKWMRATPKWSDGEGFFESERLHHDSREIIKKAHDKQKKKLNDTLISGITRSALLSAILPDAFVDPDIRIGNIDPSKFSNFFEKRYNGDKNIVLLSPPRVW
jgi:hypothetical protein